MSNSTPAGKIVIKKIKRTRRKLLIAWHNGTEDLSVNSTENALPEFHAALDALASLTCEVCAWQSDYAANMRVMGVTMGMQGEADTVSILAQKSLVDAGKALNIATPPRLLAHPTEPGSYTPPLTEAQAELVWSLIEAAKDYAKGNRAQGVLPGIGGVEEEDEGGGEMHVGGTEELKLPDDHPKKGRKPRKAKGEVIDIGQN